VNEDCKVCHLCKLSDLCGGCTVLANHWLLKRPCCDCPSLCSNAKTLGVINNESLVLRIEDIEVGENIVQTEIKNERWDNDV
jgi:hypothetical protein